MESVLSELNHLDEKSATHRSDLLTATSGTLGIADKCMSSSGGGHQATSAFWSRVTAKERVGRSLAKMYLLLYRAQRQGPVEEGSVGQA